MGLIIYFCARKRLKELRRLVSKGLFLMGSGRRQAALRCYHIAKAKRREGFDYISHKFGHLAAYQWGEVSSQAIRPLAKVERTK